MPPLPRKTTKRSSSLDLSTVKKRTHKAFKADYSIPTSNKFSALATGSPKVQVEKPIKPAPITVTDKTDIVGFLKGAKITYRLKIVSVGTKIFVDNETDFNAICAELSAKNIEFYTHPFGETKTFKLVLSGLPETPTKEIIDCLKAQNNITADKIIMFNSNGMYKRYLIHFNPKENSKSEVINVKVILNHVIKWLPVKNNRRGPSQCLRCAMYGHGISTCNRKPICLLCGDSHEAKDCKFGNEENNDQRIFKCHNCKADNLQHNHRANDPQCPARQKYIEIKTAANGKRAQITRQQQQYSHEATNFPPLRQLNPAPIPPPLTLSFAHAAKSKPSRLNTGELPQRGNGNENDMFSFAELSNILFSCINELEKCTNKYDQLKVIANLLSNVCK